jgi:LmbE family N-acetylglucosaminyl deacetylase
MLLPDERWRPTMRVVVVSPHLDDAVLSVGGTIHGLARRGADVVIVTVFAGDPEAGTPPSYWDASRGSDTQGEAVRQRRHEDESAAAELRATTRALSWTDSGYPGARDPEAIWAELRPLVESADLLLLPGWPLHHADHRYATMLVLDRIDCPVHVAFYAEQPYAAEPLTMLKGRLRNRTVAPLRHAYGDEIVWRRRALDADDRAAQHRAASHYSGELRNLGVRGRWSRIARRLSGGEWLGTGRDSAIPAELSAG